MRRIMPFLLIVIALGLGIGAGWYLRPPLPVDPAEAASLDAPATTPTAAPPDATLLNDSEVVALPSQFIVPIISEERVTAMVALRLALELAPSHGFDVARDEARLRAIFLQMLFDHANNGGFGGTYTNGEQLLSLRRNLSDAARHHLGANLRSVLITDLIRQSQ